MQNIRRYVYAPTEQDWARVSDFLWFGAPVLLVAFQLACAFTFAVGRYENLFQWDSGWYFTIAKWGYSRQADGFGQSNLNFFPVYPLLARYFSQWLSIDLRLALPACAQVTAIGFWAYWLALVRRCVGLTRGMTIAASFVLACHPGAFFLIAGYSESIFLFSTCGFIYWTLMGRRFPGFALAVLHGAMMTGSRFVGVVMATFPLVYLANQYLGSRALHRPFRATLLTLGALGGVFTHLAYLQSAFGQWNLYWETARTGWGLKPNVLFFLNKILYTHLALSAHASDGTGRLFSVLTLITVVALAFWLYHSRRWRTAPQTMSLFAMGVLLLLATLAGTVSFAGMIRYLLPIHALLVPPLFLWIAEDAPHSWRTLSLKNPLVVLSLLGLLLQMGFLAIFGRGGPVT